MKDSLRVDEDLLARIQTLSAEATTKTEVIASAVQKLSDYFIAQPKAPTPWRESWAKLAYLHYYLPLNEVRVRAVVAEARRWNFFAGLDRILDFGSGPGTASWALRHEGLNEFTWIETAGLNADVAQLSQALGAKVETQLRGRLPSPKTTLFVASYSLTETELPAAAWDCEALMILEPSTQEDGRRLLELRDRLRQKGFFLWAPCLHQNDCPLAVESKRDWCHDRIRLELPEQMKAVEARLPFRNQTLTWSYLLARKTPPPSRDARAARLVGDPLEEKGKTRQMVCRNSRREFLAWLHRSGEVPAFDRGEIVVIPSESPQVANEIRPAPESLRRLV